MVKQKQTDKQLKITLVRSLIGRKPNHRQTARSLGLRRMHRSVVVTANPMILGMINTISFMLKIEEC